MTTTTMLDFKGNNPFDSTATSLLSTIPFWPESSRALPSALLRSALFNIAHARSGPRRYLKEEQLACVKGTTMQYTGQELRQDDEDVFMQLLHLARDQIPGKQIKFTAHSMITGLRWTVNAESYARLQSCFHRLKASSLMVTVEHHHKDANGKTIRGTVSFAGSLLGDFWTRHQVTDELLDEWVVELPKAMVLLFEPELYSLINWNVRLQLTPLGKWLQGYFATSRQPFPPKVETLHKLCESKTKRMRRFRADLADALETLVQTGVLLRFKIDLETNLVYVERKFDRTTLE